MLLDSSAIISILLREPAWQQIQSRIELSTLVAVSAATLLETHMVLTNRIGKSRHKAAFNFADCIVYATAVQTELPLLYKGKDFSQTDLPLSLPLSKDSA